MTATAMCGFGQMWSTQRGWRSWSRLFQRGVWALVT